MSVLITKEFKKETKHLHRAQSLNSFGFLMSKSTIKKSLSALSSQDVNSASPESSAESFLRAKHERNGRARSSSETCSGICSQNSIMSAMDRFVASVQRMQSVVLVPSRLRDVNVDADEVTKRGSKVPETLTNVNLHGVYLMLDSVQNRLFCGPDEEEPLGGVKLPNLLGKNADSSTILDEEKIREGNIDPKTAQLAEALHTHLKGLFKVLVELSDSADYLTTKYQSEVESVAEDTFYK